MISTPRMDALAGRMDDGYDPTVAEIEEAYIGDMAEKAMRLALTPPQSRFWRWWSASRYPVT